MPLNPKKMLVQKFGEFCRIVQYFLIVLCCYGAGEDFEVVLGTRLMQLLH